jgi:hypothetical protein
VKFAIPAIRLTCLELPVPLATSGRKGIGHMTQSYHRLQSFPHS